MIQSALENGQQFRYLYKGVEKIGYWDESSKVFVATKGAWIDSVMWSSRRYIESLMKTLP